MAEPRQYVNAAAAGIRSRIPNCSHRLRYEIKGDLVELLWKIEEALGYSLVYTSGYRCRACNAAVGGVVNSEHLSGQAVDIKIIYPLERFNVIIAAIKSGIRRIGIGDTFIHIGVGSTRPQDVIWVYAPKPTLPPKPGIVRVRGSS